MTYGKEYVLCLKDNFEGKKTPEFGEIYEVDVDMGNLLQLKGLKALGIYFSHKKISKT